jgi:hypothetical protein
MKILLAGLGAALLLAGATGAGAVVCANGVYHAGCAGPNGAVAVRKAPVAPAYHSTAVVVAPHATVVAPVARCRTVNGRRVCG